MIIDEKGLLRAMKSEYKRLGYHVAVMRDAVLKTHIIITGNRWGVMMEKKNVPRKVLGLLAEHIGDIPGDDEAYKVQKGDVQTEIHESAVQTFRGFHGVEAPVSTVKRTGLTMLGYQLWQSAKDLFVMKVAPDLEEIAFVDFNEAKLVDKKMLMAEDSESRAYIAIEDPDEPSARLEYLSQFQWV